VNVDSSQFEELGQRNAYRKQYSNWQEGAWNPFHALMGTFGAGARKRNELASKAKETIMMGTLQNTLNEQGAALKHQVGQDAFFKFRKEHETQYPGMPHPQEVNLPAGIVKYPPTAGKDIAAMQQDKKIKDLQEKLAKYEKTPEDNEGKEPDAPTPGSK